jgi:hypothetical protein
MKMYSDNFFDDFIPNVTSADRNSKPIIETSLSASFNQIMVQIASRKRNNIRISFLLDFLGCFKPRHDGHCQIHQDQIKPNLPSQLDRHRPILRRINITGPHPYGLLQYLLKYHERDHLIVDYEYLQPLYPILIRLLFADGKLAALGGLIVVLEE